MHEHALTTSFHLLSHGLPALLLFALLCAGCASPPPSRLAVPETPGNPSGVLQINTALASATMGTPAVADYRLGPEDLLDITILNIPEGVVGPIPRKMEVRLSQEGLITLPLLGDLPIAGLSTTAVEQLLRQRYAEFMHDPQVGVQIKEYRGQQISVIGAVAKPGMYQLTGPRTLVDLLSMAGGISEKAGRQVYLYRQGSDERQSFVIDLLALANNPGLVNMPVQAGDVINVPLAGTFFVDGAVGKPGSYPLNRMYTLTQALAVAGGVNEALAAYDEVAIFRRQTGSEHQKIPADLKEILAGRARDPHIEAEDTIVVPISTAKYIIDRFIGRIGVTSPTLF
jgi:polysaccharide export outer membrane protein